MRSVALPWAQALRVIGQNLASLRISYFELEKWGRDYVVWIKQDESSDTLRRRKRFLGKSPETYLAMSQADTEVQNPVFQ